MGILFNIRDIQIPDDVLWWPLTLMSWLTILAVLLTIVIISWVIFRYRKKRVVHFANRTLVKLFSRYKQDQDASRFARDISILLKRIYLTIGNRSTIAGLSGKKWLNLLDQGFEDTPFATGIGQVLVTAPYQEKADFDVDSLYALCHRRIETLKVG